jgi:ferredoxin
VRLTLDPAACDGFGYCVEILRELLSFDEWGFPIVERRAVPGHLLDAARQAAQSCPRRALTVSDLAADGSGDRTRPARRT